MVPSRLRTLKNSLQLIAIASSDQVAQDTEFNGTTLLNGNATFTAGTIGTDIQVADGIEQFIFANTPGGSFVSDTDTLEIDFAANVMTVTNQVTALPVGCRGAARLPWGLLGKPSLCGNGTDIAYMGKDWHSVGGVWVLYP